MIQSKALVTKQLSFVCLICSMMCLQIANANTPIPLQPTSRLNDFTNALNSSQKQLIESQIEEFDHKFDLKLVVVCYDVQPNENESEIKSTLEQNWQKNTPEHNKRLLFVVNRTSNSLSLILPLQLSSLDTSFKKALSATIAANKVFAVGLSKAITQLQNELIIYYDQQKAPQKNTQTFAKIQPNPDDMWIGIIIVLGLMTTIILVSLLFKRQNDSLKPLLFTPVKLQKQQELIKNKSFVTKSMVFSKDGMNLCNLQSDVEKKPMRQPNDGFLFFGKW